MSDVIESVKRFLEKTSKLSAVVSAQSVIAAHALGAEVELTPEIVSLSTEYAPVTELPSGEPWRAGVRVAADTVVTYNGTGYRCIQGHVTQSDWTPGTAAALWEVVQREPEGDDILPWSAGEAVKAGDKRTYGGVTYECVQGHTAQAGWEPPNVAALWRKFD